MREKYIPKLNLSEDIGETKLYSFNKPVRMNAVKNSPEIPAFSDVMTGMVKELDNTIKAPDQIMQDVMLDKGADIHDAMIAISKAEVTINFATQLTTKVVQAYEKIMSIQI
ncbi:MAG: flagellar hook-basal body complex protein FliE [bacterium]